MDTSMYTFRYGYYQYMGAVMGWIVILNI
eukprot:SAG31_NODE_11463_length_1027_cov_1.103448_1_plen_28_part_01